MVPSTPQVANQKKQTPGPARAEAPQPAGNFSAWLRRTRRSQALKVIGAEVPCGTCSACCRSSFFIHIRPDEKRTLAHIPKALLFPAPGLPKGHVLMGYNERGECPMWIDQRCSIYEVRPQTCRDYDCRVFTATGIAPDDDSARRQIAERARSWRFDYPAETDRKDHAAVQRAARFLQDRRDCFPSGTLPRHPSQLAALAIRVYKIFLRFEDTSARGGQIPPDAEIARSVLAAMESPARTGVARPR